VSLAEETIVLETVSSHGNRMTCDRALQVPNRPWKLTKPQPQQGIDRGVAQLASSWVPSTRNFKPSIDERTALNSIERHSNVSWACGPRLEASRAIPQE
jgi:hypothetical protein